MNKDTMKGHAKDAMGEVKKQAGKMTGNPDLEASGRADKAEGKVDKAIGKTRDAMKGK